jgi:catechol 2,3-dioxygenase-like lactoylglutathione lyase family enzyme
VFDHVAIAVSDLAASEGFYRTALSVLGVEPSDADAELVEWEDWDIGATDREHPVTRGLHVGFRARDRAQVDAFWQAGIDAGYRDDGAPGPRTHYGPAYYGGFPARPGWVLQFVESAHGPSSRPYLTLRPRLRRTDQFGADGKREFVRQAIRRSWRRATLPKATGRAALGSSPSSSPYREADDQGR